MQHVASFSLIASLGQKLPSFLYSLMAAISQEATFNLFNDWRSGLQPSAISADEGHCPSSEFLAKTLI